MAARGNKPMRSAAARAYRLRSTEIEQLSIDQTLPGFATVLTQALGHGEVQARFSAAKLKGGDVLLLCARNTAEAVGEDALRAVNRASANLEEAADGLALRGGGAVLLARCD
jgi:serine/threonine protein phosphatase PrpC